MPDHRVVIADLGYGIDGVPGINFLRHFDIEIRFADRRILVEQIAPWTRGKTLPRRTRSDPTTP